VDEAGTRQLQGIHVLVVEDDESARHVLQRVLELWGALVSVSTGADALRTALKADVIVVDLATAEAAGRQFLLQLRMLHSRPIRPVPTIALVPLGMTIPATPRAAGVQRYLTKPAEPDDLRAAVWELARE
jgi:CheY-like chemotaxis protein